MAYFECRLPLSVPDYYHSSIRQRLKETVEKVYERSEKLESALALSGLRPAVFHRQAKFIFDKSAERFDSLSPEALARCADLLYDGSEVPERTEWPNTEVLFDTAFVTTGDWELLRHLGIGGSDSSTVLGINHYNSTEGLWYNKLGAPRLVKPEENQAVFDRGHFLEDRVIEIFCRMHDAERIPETRMFRSTLYPYSIADLDAVLRFPDGSLYLFEAKTAADCGVKRDAWKGDNVPANYVSQVYHYLGVMNDPRIRGVYIAMLPVSDYKLAGTYVGSRYDTEPGDRDFFFHFMECGYAYSKEILEAEEDFWTEYIEKQKKPGKSSDGVLNGKLAEIYRPSPLSAADPRLRDVTLDKSLWADNTVTLEYEAVKELLQRVRNADEEYSRARSVCDSCEKAKKALYVELTDLLNGAPLGEVKDSAGKVRYTITRKVSQKRTISAVDVAAFYPEVFGKLGNVSETLRTTLKEGSGFAVTAKKKSGKAEMASD